MICPHCKEWIDTANAECEEISRVNYIVGVDFEQVVSESSIESGRFENVTCPECAKELGDFDEVMRKLEKCNNQEYKEECDTCEDRFVCLTQR